MRDLNDKISLTLQPVFTSRRLEQDLKPKEAKPSIVNQQCVVHFSFVCDLCDADYVGYTARHLFRQRVAEAIFQDSEKVQVQGKFDCLVFEMLHIKKFKPNLNVQTDSIYMRNFLFKTFLT